MSGSPILKRILPSKLSVSDDSVLTPKDSVLIVTPPNSPRECIHQKTYSVAYCAQHCSGPSDLNKSCTNGQPSAQHRTPQYLDITTDVVRKAVANGHVSCALDVIGVKRAELGIESWSQCDYERAFCRGIIDKLVMGTISYYDTMVWIGCLCRLVPSQYKEEIKIKIYSEVYLSLVRHNRAVEIDSLLANEPWLVSYIDTIRR